MPLLRQQDSRTLQNLQHQMLNSDCGRVLGRPINRPHGPQAGGDTPTLSQEVTAEILNCRPGPLLLLLAQLYFQKASADSGSAKISTVRADVDARALFSTAF